MEDNVISGSPTKSFFIKMITRDISIKDAIIDLLDNSIDGASRISPKDFEGLFIKIEISGDEFVVIDNCGGFSLETAKKYAFRFGRPDNAPESTGSIGRFGIGMKRALFKIGKNFEVESKTNDDHFEVNVNVEEWSKREKKVKQGKDETEVTIEDWDFRYNIINDDNRNLNLNGTYVKVTNLYKEVADLFSEESFLNSLEEEIERLLNFSLEKNIHISLNGKKLSSKNIQIFNDQSKPFFYEGEKDGVRFKVIAGLGEVGNPDLSGWYIYCNDRLVVEGDKSEITGWGTPGIRKWHIDFVMFRGVVFMDSEETFKLPLTTTKKGIDATSDVYKSVSRYMKEAMTSVIPFLSQVTKLGNEANDYRKLLGENENKISVVEMKTSEFKDEIKNARFSPPELDSEKISQKKDTVRIAYDVKKKLANTVKLHSNSKSYKEVGETTFEYYCQMEEILANE